MSIGRTEPFDIHEVMDRVRDAVAEFPKAALFELAEEGYDSPYEQLIACIISMRTRDETMLPTALSLFQRARTPAEMMMLSWEELDRLIGAATFHEQKARNILALSQTLVDEYDGALPCDEALMLSFHGVGPKCTNLVLGISCDARFIGVDVHVHRVTNRWGYVSTNAPEQTMRALEEKLPHAYWLEINRLLVPFGKHICTGRLPRCSTCPVEPMCAQVGVKAYR
ncbi:MAG: endonuclease III [Anaerolineae bacterium]|nr:endonuclease III [Anaerolineae bacterium]